jgi:rRNA maturation RNase YbeY
MIAFHVADIKFSLRNAIAHKKFIAKQVADYVKKERGNTKFKLDLSFIFCSDEYLLNINRQFLNHDYYTDIITFPLENTLQGIEAEIYISLDRVLENSVQYGSVKRATAKIAAPVKPFASEPFNNELDRVVFHGVLHLLGYKDKSTVQKAEMRRMEDKWLRQYNKFLNE